MFNGRVPHDVPQVSERKDTDLNLKFNQEEDHHGTLND